MENIFDKYIVHNLLYQTIVKYLVLLLAYFIFLYLFWNIELKFVRDFNSVLDPGLQAPSMDISGLASEQYFIYESLHRMNIANREVK